MKSSTEDCGKINEDESAGQRVKWEVKNIKRGKQNYKSGALRLRGGRGDNHRKTKEEGQDIKMRIVTIKV